MRTIRDARLESRPARLRLAPKRQPHWKTLVPARLHLGYRRRQRNLPGTWLVRHYVGEERYRVAPLGLADDFHDAADGVIDFAEAQRRALTHKLSAGTPPGGPPGGGAVERHIQGAPRGPPPPAAAGAAPGARPPPPQPRAPSPSPPAPREPTTRRH